MPRTTNDRGRVQGILVGLVTFVSIFAILSIWLRGSDASVFWFYSVCTTSFLLIMYVTTTGYRPVEDSGFRPDLSIIIPAKNEEEVIGEVVRTVFESDYPASRMEVIVVDDGSTDRTWERVQEAKVELGYPSSLITIRHDRNYGKRVALASAVTRSKGEVIVCIDSDSFVEPDAIRLLVQPFRDRKVMAVSGHGKAVDDGRGLLARIQHYWYAETFRLMKGMESRLGVVSCCSGMLAAYRRAAILPVMEEWLREKDPESAISASTLQDPKIRHGLWKWMLRSPGEDRILTAYALSNRSAKAVYQSNAVVRTIVPERPRQFLRQQLRWNRAWIHGSVLSSTFMWKKSFPSSLVFYLYQFVSFLSPIAMLWWLIVDPLNGRWLGALGFLIGTLYVGFLHGMNTWNQIGGGVKTILYRTMFVFVSLFLTATIMLYGWFTPWKMGWITRSENVKSETRVPVLPQSIPA